MIINRLISIAPMMRWTDRHDRYFLRLISPHVLLYTEMVTTGALIHGDFKRFLQFHPLEHPVALQLGGSEPKQLAHCAKLGADFGYDEINLNVGCPSDRVQSGRLGACLMLEPDLVAESVEAMVSAVTIPVTVKCRIGVDHEDSYESLYQFIACIAKAGCQVFIIHARKAWLKGLSPKQNRDIPPLCYEVVWQIKRDFPDLMIIINGGIKKMADLQDHLSRVDGVMIGREAYANPYLLADIEEKYFGTSVKKRQEIVEQFIPYIELQLQNKIKLSKMTRHILGLFQNQKGGRMWRRYLSEHAYHPNAGSEVVQDALNKIVSAIPLL
jgi:tRNA-dihydrouridine synthase A